MLQKSCVTDNVSDTGNGMKEPNQPYRLVTQGNRVNQTFAREAHALRGPGSQAESTKSCFQLKIVLI